MKPGDGWLTEKRLRAHGLLLAVALWSLYIWTLATPGLRDRNGNFKGTDFLHFYTLGTLAIEHRGADLYRMSAQAAVGAQRMPQTAGIRYLPLYPPQVSLLFAPFARLPYLPALILWWVCCGILYAICCYALWRSCAHLRPHGATAAILAVAFPAFFNLIAWGQSSAIALACFTALYFLLREKRELLAGMVLGCLIFKPQLALVAAIVFLAIRSWKIVVGAVLSSAAQFSVAILYYGVAPLREWITALWRAPAMRASFEPRIYQTHCLRTFWEMIVPWPRASIVLYAVSSLLVLVITVGRWRRRDFVPLEMRYSALLLGTVLVSPHLTVYDLIILAPVFFLIANLIVGGKGGNGWGTVLYLIYALPLLGALTRWTHVQLSIVAIAGLLFLIWRTTKLPGQDLTAKA